MAQSMCLPLRFVLSNTADSAKKVDGLQRLRRHSHEKKLDCYRLRISADAGDPKVVSASSTCPMRELNSSSKIETADSLPCIATLEKGAPGEMDMTMKKLILEIKEEFNSMDDWERSPSAYGTAWWARVPAITFISCILFFSRVLNFLRKNNNGARLLPPGPSPLPIIGNMHQLGKLPHRDLHELANRYGPLMHLRFGSVPVLVVSSCKGAKEFLKTHDMIFANRPTSAAGKLIGYNHKDIVFASYGPYWRKMRKVCVMELLSLNRIESFTYVRKEEVLNMISSIWNMSQQGRVSVDVSQSMSSFSSGIICRMLAGRKLTDADLSATGSSMTFKGLIEEMSNLAGTFNVGDFIPSIDWLDLQGLKRRMEKVHKLFDGVAENIIEEHMELRRGRSSGDTYKENKASKDLVDVLLDISTNDTINKTDTNITREDVKAIFLDMFAGGMETTATTLEWAMSELVLNPSIQKKLQQEIESVVGKDVTVVAESAIASMEYLDCVVKETLRLHPASPLLVPHESTQACDVKALDGDVYTIPAKTMLIVNAWAIGRDPEVWEDPLTFRPERFMGMRFDPVKDQEMRMLPFGAGRRACPGANMGLSSMKIALAQLLHSFDWRLGGGEPCELDMNEKFGVTIPRKTHLFAFPQLRRPLTSTIQG